MKKIFSFIAIALLSLSVMFAVTPAPTKTVQPVKAKTTTTKTVAKKDTTKATPVKKVHKAHKGTKKVVNKTATQPVKKSEKKSEQKPAPTTK
ncbi:MAG TPA: acid-shock protein [Candidatus Cloacimonadota bacterium]|nr:acid-shock protein [Candidatus Cloacimonadota bacterium]HPT73173.1 acid-shock protein [Candidatus Cloacimonadota bacterium]